MVVTDAGANIISSGSDGDATFAIWHRQNTGKQKAYGCCLPSLSPFHSLSNQLANHQLKSEAGKKRRESKTIRQQLSSANTHHHHLTCFERKRRRRKRKIRSSGCTAFLKDITNDDLMEEQTNKHHHPLFTSSKWTQGRRSASPRTLPQTLWSALITNAQ